MCIDEQSQIVLSCQHTRTHMCAHIFCRILAAERALRYYRDDTLGRRPLLFSVQQHSHLGSSTSSFVLPSVLHVYSICHLFGITRRFSFQYLFSDVLYSSYTSETLIIIIISCLSLYYVVVAFPSILCFCELVRIYVYEAEIIIL